MIGGGGGGRGGGYNDDTNVPEGSRYILEHL